MIKKRKYNTNFIKATLNYSVNDISELFKVHKRTVQEWLKEGLYKIDNRKPFLVLGSDLEEFIKNRQGKRKVKCNSNEFYCLKCHKSQTSWNNLVDINILNESRVMIIGICSQCNTKINKISTTEEINNIKQIFMVQKIHNKNLIEFNSSILKTDIKKEN